MPGNQRTGLLFELSAAPDSSQQQVDIGRLLMRRPVAAFALVPRPALLFAAGAVAGALGGRPSTHWPIAGLVAW